MVASFRSQTSLGPFIQANMRATRALTEQEGHHSRIKQAFGVVCSQRDLATAFGWLPF